MNIEYYILNPTGNLTALVTSPLSEEFEQTAAQKLFSLEKVEQVGFISGFKTKNAQVKMSGGEFCGNAAMCAGVINAVECGLNSCDISVKFYGTSGAVPVSAKEENGDFYASVLMPKPVSLNFQTYELDGKEYRLFTVKYEKIVHLISYDSFSVDFAEKAIKKWCLDIKADALGIMFLNRDNGSLKPLVYVPSSEALFWEGSCASGTAAIGEYLFFEKKEYFESELSEPCGKLKVTKNSDGLYLFGKITDVLKKNTEILI